MNAIVTLITAVVTLINADYRNDFRVLESMGMANCKAAAEVMAREADQDGDGSIGFREFSPVLALISPCFSHYLALI